MPKKTGSANVIEAFFNGASKLVRTVTEHSWGVAKAAVIVAVAYGVSPIVQAGILQNVPFVQLAVFFVVFIVGVIAMVSLAAKSDKRR